MAKQLPTVVDLTTAQAKMAADIMAGTTEVITAEIERSRQVIMAKYGTSAHLPPTSQAIYGASGSLPLFIKIARLGNEGLHNVGLVAGVMMKIGAEGVDPFTSCERVESALKVIERRHLDWYSHINYGLVIGAEEKHPYDKFISYSKAKKGARAMGMFASLYPEEYQCLAGDTARAMQLLRRLAKAQMEKSGKLLEEFKKEFAGKNLLGQYGQEYEGHTEVIRSKGPERNDMKSTLLRNAMKPSASASEVPIVTATIEICDAIVGQAEALGKFLARTLAVTSGSDATVYGTLTSVASGYIPMLHGLRYGSLVAQHWGRMISVSMLASAMATGQISNNDAVRIQEKFHLEDQALQRAILR